MAKPAEPKNSPRTADGLPVTADADRVFISYASSDAAVASALVENLERNGIACWIAPRDVDAGARYAEAIIRAISGARAFVLVLSKNSIDSSHVGKEVERASSKNRPIFALRIDVAQLSPAFEYFLSESQWVDAQTAEMDLAFTRLIAGIRKFGPLVSESIADVTPGTSATKVSAQRRRLRPRIVLAAGFAVFLLAPASLLINRFRLAKRATLEQSAMSAASGPAAAKSVGTATSEKSIAVLPFADMSEKKDQEYFADGMAEEIIDLLAKVPDLQIPARTSSFYFKGKATRISEIARELGVAHVLEGSIRRSGDNLRVTAQLIRADNGFLLWSQTYDRELRDIFKVQDEIANAVVQALQIGLMGGPLNRSEGGTENLEAYQSYLRAVSAGHENSRASVQAADRYLEQAIKLDPNFGLAWSELSMEVIKETDASLLPPKQGYERARHLAQHALGLSPNLANAHAALQYIYRTLDWDWVASEAEGRLALRLNVAEPHALMFGGMLSATLGRWKDADQRMRSALSRDPLNPLEYANFGDALYGAGRFIDAEAAYRKAIELSPHFVWAPSALSEILLAEGKVKEALIVLQQDPDEHDRLTTLPIVLQAARRKVEADEAFKTLIARHSDDSAYYIAMTYAYRGDHDLALQWLDRAFNQKDPGLVYIVGEHLFKTLRDDPRFGEFLSKMNLTAYSPKPSLN